MGAVEKGMVNLLQLENRTWNMRPFQPPGQMMFTIPIYNTSFVALTIDIISNLITGLTHCLMNIINHSGMFQFSIKPTIEEFRAEHKTFNYEKMKWGPWQTPRNLFLALIGELGELSVDIAANEDFANPRDCSEDEETDSNTADNIENESSKVDEVLSELIDVLSYVICLADECQVDIAVPDSQRNDKSTSTFSNATWNEIEVTAFYQTAMISENTTIMKDFLNLCFSASKLKDTFQWGVIERNLDNISMDKQQIVDKLIKQVFCHVVVIASKYEYDLPKLLKEKNVRIAEKYSQSIGRLTKDDVIKSRYSDLPSFQYVSNCDDSNSNTSSEKNEITGCIYLLDRAVGDLKISEEQLLCKLVHSIGLIAEIFQWDTDGTETDFSPAKHAHLCKQLSTIMDVVRTLAQFYKISLAESFTVKMQKNRTKYPLSTCRGTFMKYDENVEKVPNVPGADSDVEHPLYPTVSTVSDAALAMKLFVEERDWQKYHKNPRNLTLALFGEIGEVIELFITKRNDKFDQCLGDELSDCLAYCVRLASCCNVDLSAALSHYFP